MRRFTSILSRTIPKSPKETKTSPQCWFRSYSDIFLFSKPNHHINQIGLFTCNFPSTKISSSKQPCACFSTLRNLPEVEIISEEFIKPATPTPEHLRTYAVSRFDQFFMNNLVPFIYFYPNHNENENESHDDLMVRKRKILKQSLSETLARFYPVAGKLKDIRLIDCNDDGVHYAEAKVHERLSDFLKQPDNKSIHRLLPMDPNSEELLSKLCLAMVQVNIFSCGGIAIGLYTSHKILDGYSFATFIKAWAAAARNSPNQIYPSFDAPSIFPPDPEVPKEPPVFSVSAPNERLTKRFVFGASSLATLKTQAESSRIIALKAFLWKCTVATCKVRSMTQPKHFSLAAAVNLRDRSSPPVPPYCIGNIVWHSKPIQSSVDEDFLLNHVAKLLKQSTDKLDTNAVEKMKSEGYALEMDRTLNKLATFYNDRVNFKHTFISSLCNSGMYESDFGWGKPVWVSYGLADTAIYLTENSVVLMDTRSGEGIEAWVTLGKEDMAIFEGNQELLSLASLNPSPLQPFE